MLSKYLKEKLDHGATPPLNEFDPYQSPTGGARVAAAVAIENGRMVYIGVPWPTEALQADGMLPTKVCRVLDVSKDGSRIHAQTPSGGHIDIVDFKLCTLYIEKVRT